MRVAVVAESFLPHLNGVTGSVLRVLDHLSARGHPAMVVAAGHRAPISYRGTPVVHVPSVGVPGYPQVRISVATAHRLTELLGAFAPDVVHLASPLLLGNTATKAASTLDVPTVAVFQTDVAAFAERYGFPGWSQRIWNRTQEIHGAAARTLAPSEHAERALHERGVPRVHRWARGVDVERFRPRTCTFGRFAAPGRVVVGFHGRLAPEKQLEDLAVLDAVPGVQLVLVGDGPSRTKLRALLPGAVFTGSLTGDDLADAVASFDVMVHPGESETFCQSVQEALASGVPVIAPAAGGVQELVVPSRTGWLYAPGDAAGLRAAVLDLVGDGAKRRAFGAAARQAVRGRSWEVLGDQLIDHYRHAIREHTGIRR